VCPQRFVVCLGVSRRREDQLTRFRRTSVFRTRDTLPKRASGRWSVGDAKRTNFAGTAEKGNDWRRSSINWQRRPHCVFLNHGLWLAASGWEGHQWQPGWMGQQPPPKPLVVHQPPVLPLLRALVCTFSFGSFVVCAALHCLQACVPLVAWLRATPTARRSGGARLAASCRLRLRDKAK
jgi:hypothetical protein